MCYSALNVNLNAKTLSVGLVYENGSVWRDHRRFALQTLRDLGFGKGSMEDRVVDEIGYLTRRIDETRGQAFDFHQFVAPSVSNNICHLVFGHRYDYGDPRRRALDKLIRDMSHVFSVIGVLAMSPLWFSKLAFRAGTVGKKAQFDMAFDIFEYKF